VDDAGNARSTPVRITGFSSYRVLSLGHFYRAVVGYSCQAPKAEVLGLSAQSVMRDWKLAKAWLLRELSGEIGPG
jgi:hypothetical protein